MFRQLSRILSRKQHPGQDLSDVPGLVSSQGFKFVQHLLVIGKRLAVDGEHTGGFPDAHSIDASEHEVDIACQGGDVGNFRDKGLAPQHRLIQVGNGPALGNVKTKAGCELFRSFRRHGILPGTERG